MTATRTRKARAVTHRGPSAGYRVHVDARGLRMAMKLQRINGAELARVAGVAEGTVRNLTSGGRDTCNAETAAALSKVLRLDREDLGIFEIVRTHAHA